MVDIDEQPPSFTDDWDVLREISPGIGSGTSDVSEVLANDALDRAGLPKFAYSVFGGTFGLADLSVWRIQILKETTKLLRMHGQGPHVIIKYIEPIFVGAKARNPIFVDKNGATLDTFSTSLRQVSLDQAAVEQAIAEKVKAMIQSYKSSIAQWGDSIRQLEKDIVTYQERVAMTEAFEPSSVWRKDGG